MNEPKPPLLSLDEMTDLRLANIPLAVARETYAAELALDPHEMPAAFGGLMKASEAVPYDRLAVTDLALASLRLQLEAGVRESELPHADAVALAGSLASILWEGQDTAARLDFVAEMERDFSSILEDAGQAWPLPWPKPQEVPPLPEPQAKDHAEELAAKVESNADIAARLPRLDSVIVRATSEHAAVHQRLENISMALQRRRELPRRSAERNATDVLVQRIILLERRFLEAPGNRTYHDYFAPEEIIALTDKLIHAYNHRHDPAFIAEVAERAQAAAGDIPYYERKENGFYDFVRDDEPASYADHEESMADPEIAWDPEVEHDEFDRAVELAREGSEKLRHYMFAGLSQNKHRNQYLIDVCDPEADDLWPGMRDIYQFIADEHVQEVLGTRRQTMANNTLRKACEANRQTILHWRRQNASLIAQIPTDFQLEQKMKINKTQLERALENLPAVSLLDRLIGLMNARYESTDTNGPLIGFATRPHAFYKLQLKIMLTVNDIKEQLPSHSGGPSMEPVESLV